LTSEWVRTAHADAWEVHGLARVDSGGGAVRLPGVRLMATGLPHPQWNNGDVTAPDHVDLEAVRAWYAERSVPWGLRLPKDASWPHGRKLFTKRLMGATPEGFTPSSTPAGVLIRAAEVADTDRVVAVDAVAFEAPPEVERGWVAPLISTATFAVAEIAGEIVATGNGVYADGDAGPSGYVAGIGVLPEFRRRGIGAAITSWLAGQLLDAGAQLLHLHPDTESAAAIYRRLGFIEVDGFDVYVDMA
jgi:ribosomal protein S18 acetylase RimI-like enzyme